jgi:hypothetical protein
MGAAKQSQRYSNLMKVTRVLGLGVTWASGIRMGFMPPLNLLPTGRVGGLPGADLFHRVECTQFPLARSGTIPPIGTPKGRQESSMPGRQALVQIRQPEKSLTLVSILVL